MTYIIRTNNQPRWVLSWEELTEAERTEVDYRTAEDGASFARYCGALYDLSDFPRASDDLKPWDGALADSAFSAVVFRWTEDGDNVIMGTVLS